MFHRPRPGLQLHPVTVPAMTEDAAVDALAANPVPDSGPVLSSSISQPEPNQKETSPMSSTFTPAPSQPESPETASVPTTASYAAPNGQSRPATPQPMAMARSPYAYGGPSFSGSAESALSTGRKLVIGEGITMSGEIEACDHLVVEGTVEATLKGASVLDIAQSGMFFGAVEINEGTIAGRFEGDLVVNGRLTIRATGTVSGSLSYKELAVEAGATIEGKITPMREGRMASGQKPTPAKQKADSTSELPFSGKSQAAA